LRAGRQEQAGATERPQDAVGGHQALVFVHRARQHMPHAVRIVDQK